ncbi:MAG: hypothetical protein PHE17_17605 [Thiothrix sp.]|jgi:hypothetical protein|uniref:hypothetical protein n=1 Tax=Thiothrix sp. TaxID=1032 RepID=UPI002614A5F6|nr:hypothetical protein [Thiothrix sp.]MDD5394837.1 hypothetical protein [Thiothrix sp.]
MMASIIKDPGSECADDHILVVEDPDSFDNLAWVKVGADVVYIRKDADGTLVVRAMPDDGSDALYGEIVVPHH